MKLTLDPTFASHNVRQMCEEFSPDHVLFQVLGYSAGKEEINEMMDLKDEEMKRLRDENKALRDRLSYYESD